MRLRLYSKKESLTAPSIGKVPQRVALVSKLNNKFVMERYNLFGYAVFVCVVFKRFYNASSILSGVISCTIPTPLK